MWHGTVPRPSNSIGFGFIWVSAFTGSESSGSLAIDIRVDKADDEATIGFEIWNGFTFVDRTREEDFNPIRDCLKIWKRAIFNFANPSEGSEIRQVEVQIKNDLSQSVISKVFQLAEKVFIDIYLGYNSKPILQ